jgi:hypothetical protein
MMRNSVNVKGLRSWKRQSFVVNRIKDENRMTYNDSSYATEQRGL